MPIINSNFEFLKADFPDLYRIGASAETLYSIDIESCIAKIRVFAECWLKLFYETNKIVYNPVATLAELLVLAEDDRLLPDDVYHLIDNIRVKGNVASHATISLISGRMQTVDFPKSELKSLLQDAFMLAEYSFRQLHQQDKVPFWKEPEDLTDLKLYKQAFNGEPAALLDIASKKFEQIVDLPKDNKLSTRNEAKRLMGEFQMWKERCIAVGVRDIYCLEYFIYSGTGHQSLKDNKQLRNIEKLVKKHVDDSMFHFMKGMHLHVQHQYVDAASHLRLAYDQGRDDCFDDLLECYFYSDYERFTACLQIGAKKRNFNGSLLYVLQLLAEKDDPNNKEIKHLIHFCHSQNSKVGDYLHAIYECLLHSHDALSDDKFDPDFNVIASDWKLLPDISYGACLSVYYLTHYEQADIISKELLELAITSSQRMPTYRVVLHSAFHTIMHHQEKNNPKFGHFDAGALLRKSAKLGYKPAQTIIDKMEYRKKFKVKGKRGKPDRKSVKAKRKQNR